jgi:DNA-binding transcriptional LysR family regulator
MELRQLEYVVAIAETGSFTRAGERCHIAQSALSHQIARLEAQLDCRLFVRGGRTVTLTAAGMALLPHARRILHDVADARLELASLVGVVRGRVRVGMTQTAERLFDLMGIAAEYRAQFPDVELCLSLGPAHELVREVAEGTIDIAIASEREGSASSTVDYRPLVLREPLVAVVGAAHPLAHQKKVFIRELAAVDDFVEFRSGSGLRDQVDALFRAAGLPERHVAFEVGQISEMVRFARSGLGTAIVPRVFTEGTEGRGDEAGRPRVLAIADPGAFLSLGEYRRLHGVTPAVLAFSERLVVSDARESSLAG